MADVAAITIRRGGLPAETRQANMEEYVEWLLVPSEARVPSTKRAFADEMGVTTQTLRNYARDPWVQSEMSKRARAINKVERAPDVVDALYDIATDPEQTPSARVSAAKGFLDWTDKTVAELTKGDLLDMSFDDLHKMIDEAERASLA